MVEFMYPLIQGYDSVVLESDLEIGGSDQLFNMLVGRNLQKDMGGVTQSVLTMPLLVGLDGVRKMSKSYDNYIAFNDSSKNIFGKIMSVSDDAMWEYYKLLLNYDESGLNELKKLHPMEAKKTLAESLTSLFFDSSVAQKEKEEFSKVFSRGKLPKDMPTYSITSLNGEKSSLLNILVSTGEFDSKGSIRRLVKQGGVKVDEQKVEDPEKKLNIEDGMNEIIIRAGKKIFIRVVA
jgi:tyrosyl-tRNA synthetase